MRFFPRLSMFCIISAIALLAAWPGHAKDIDDSQGRALQKVDREGPSADAEHTGNIFLEGEKVSIPIPARQQGKASAWRVLDDRGTEKKRGSLREEDAIIVGRLPIGWYRIELLDEGGKCLDFTTAAVLAKLQAPVPQDSPVCIDAAISWLGSDKSDKNKFDPEKNAKLTNLAALAGCNWIRDRLRWREMQAGPDEFSEPNKYDTMAKIQTRQGMKVLQTFHTTPRWARDTSNKSRADLRHLYRFCKSMAKRFKGSVHAWEPWNEGNAGNFGGHTIDELCSLQKAAYLGFKAGDPDLTVCWNPLGGATSKHLADGILGNETWPYYDVYSIHSYDWPSAFERRWTQAQRAAAGLPIWVTEIDRGLKADPESKPGDYTHEDAVKKAQLIAQEHARSLFCGATRHFHFILGDYMEGKHRVQFGLLRHDNTPRLSFVALAAVGRFLAGVKCLGRYEIAGQEDSHIYAFRGQPDGKQRDVLIAWHEKKVDWPSRGKQAVDWTLPPDVKVEAAYDYLGRPLDETPSQLKSAPVFLVLPAGEVSKLPLRTVSLAERRTGPGTSPIVMQLHTPGNPPVSRTIDWIPEHARVFEPGKKTKCVVIVYNLSDSPAQGALRLDNLPTGWTFSKSEWNVKIAPMGRATVELDITRPADQPESQPWITIRGDFGQAGKPVLSFEAANVKN